MTTQFLSRHRRPDRAIAAPHHAQPGHIITTTIMPIAFLLLFVYVFGGAINTGSDLYVNYLLPASYDHRRDEQDAGQQVVHVRIRAGVDRAAEHVDEQQQEGDRHDRGRDDGVRAARDVAQRSPGQGGGAERGIAWSWLVLTRWRRRLRSGWRRRACRCHRRWRRRRLRASAASRRIRPWRAGAVA